MSKYAYDASKLGPYRVDPMAHYGLAVTIVQRTSCPGHLTREDMVQEALAVLCAAARTYDPDLGHPFSTWAGRLIRNHLSTVYAQYHRVGSVGTSNQRCLSRALRTYLKEFDPSSDPAVIRSLLQDNRYWSHATDYDCGMIVQATLHADTSLDETWDHREGEDAPGAKVPLVETVPDERLEFEFLNLSEGLDAERLVRKALGWMTPRERELCLQRTLDPDTDTTLDDFGERWGVTRQRVQQIEAGVVEKLRRAYRLISERKGLRTP